MSLCRGTRPVTKLYRGTREVVKVYRGTRVVYENDPGPAPVTLNGIYIYHEPDKVDYQSGDTLDLTGLIVYATYSDGTENEVTGDCTFEPLDGAVLIGGSDIEQIFIPVDIFYSESGVNVRDSFFVGVTGATTLDYSYNASTGALSFTEVGTGGEYEDWAFDGTGLWLNSGDGGGE